MTELQSTILCPVCGYAATETMPTNACVLAYECARCGTRPDTEEGRLLCLLLLWLGTMSTDAEHKALIATRGKIKAAASAKPALSVGPSSSASLSRYCPIGPKSRALHARPSMHNLIRYS
jgi:hypothetical protein